MSEILSQLVARLDGWSNALSGLGLASRDRAAGLTFSADERLDYQTLRGLFRGDAVARRIVSIFPSEALREGLGPLPEGLAGKLAQIGALPAIEKAATWGRLYGAGLIVMGLGDGAPADSPFTGGPCDVHYLDVYARPQIQRGYVYDDPRDRMYQRARTFRITPVRGPSFEVHRSRCLLFGGVLTPDENREENGGFDDSVLQAIYPTLRDFNNGYAALGNMLTDASQPVIRMKGLLSAIAADGAQGSKIVSVRAQLLDLSRSVAKALLLDADSNESFEKIATQFSGVPESVDRLANKLAADTGVPVTVLMGQAPAGLAATGDADIRGMYDRAAAYRGKDIEPQVARLLSILAGETVPIAWPPLWAPGPKEAAEIGKIQADTDAVYEGLGVLTPEEIARARFGSGGPQPMISEAALAASGA